MEKYNFSTGERALMENLEVPFAIYQFYEKRVRTLVLSKGFLEVFGYTDREKAYYDMDNNMYVDTHPDDVARIEDAAIRFATEGGVYEVVYRTKKKDGAGYYIIHAKGKHVYTESGARLAQVWYTNEGDYISGIESKEGIPDKALDKAIHDEDVIRAMHYDFLTGLPNMNYFFELAGSAQDKFLAEGKKPTLLFMDLSGMKFFNHRFGFGEGNKLLRAFAGLLTTYFGHENCSRFAKDHFAVITDDPEIKETLDSLFEDLRSMPEDTMLPVRVGIYQIQEKETDLSEAYDKAKLACDELKNTYTSAYNDFSDSMREKASIQHYLVSNIDKAIENKWISVYFQPIIRSVNGRVCDEEALARWIDPEVGFLSPGDFIPILEETHLIYKLDLYILEQVLEKLKIQAAAGLEMVPQSINLSRADFDSCDPVEEIRKRVDAAGIGRDKITIEITESVIGKDFDFMKEQVIRFRNLGFSVWMDDFGSGYSTLDALQSIPFNLIKFDMRFMQEFDQGEKNRVILTELMQMATALGLDTVCEGVETKEQVQFLQEIGCTRLQGFYYCKPIPLEELLKRYEEKRQIGYENVKESKYYDTVGKVNLYDLSVMGNKDEGAFSRYFNTLPMAIIEVKDDEVRFIRSNASHQEFLRRKFHVEFDDVMKEFSKEPKGIGKSFLGSILQCSRNGNRMFVDEKLSDGTSVHSFAKRLAVNPVTKTSAIGVVVLSIVNADQGATYENIARALAADYFNLFYVDLENDSFIEYTSGVGEEALSSERHGENFFEASQRDARKLIYEEDQDNFIKVFTKENVVRIMDEQGTFTITYRLKSEAGPIYVLMKGMRMDESGRYIILGVSSVDTQMRERAANDRIRQDQIAYSRIAALSGGYIVLYTVDPETDHFVEYNANADYSGLGLSKEGEDFFGVSLREGPRTIAEADLPYYSKMIRKENVMKEIRRNGRFTMRYHLLINGKPCPVRLRAAVVKESDGDKLIVGVRETEEWT